MLNGNYFITLQNMEQISVTEYAELANLSRQYVLRLLPTSDIAQLTGVKSAKKVGNNWIIKVKRSEIVPRDKK